MHFYIKSEDVLRHLMTSFKAFLKWYIIGHYKLEFVQYYRNEKASAGDVV